MAGSVSPLRSRASLRRSFCRSLGMRPPPSRNDYGSPVVVNGSLYVGSYDGNLYEFDLKS